MKSEKIDEIIKAALKEDMPSGDITSENILSKDQISSAVILAKEKGILAGIEVAERVFHWIDPSINFSALHLDGDELKPGDWLAELQGNSIALLKGERTALNFLQRMSGIATLTKRYMDALKGTRTKILDTRKTTPGLRSLEKYAVKMGGGENHRMSLSDMVLIKDNHLRLVGSISEAVRRARKKVGASVKIEVETTSLDEVKQAVECGADLVMLDNMTTSQIKDVVLWTKGRVPLEVSGNVDLKRIRELAYLGVDFISVGGLTHSFKSLDISMDFI